FGDLRTGHTRTHLLRIAQERPHLVHRLCDLERLLNPYSHLCTILCQHSAITEWSNESARRHHRLQPSDICTPLTTSSSASALRYQPIDSSALAAEVIQKIKP